MVPFTGLLDYSLLDFYMPRSMAENFSAPRRVATSLNEHPAWLELEGDGFSRVDKLKDEIRKPHQVGYLFDTEAECLEVVKGLHGADYYCMK